MRKELRALGVAVAAVFCGFLVQPVLPLGDWGWGLAAVGVLTLVLIWDWRNIVSDLIPSRKFKKLNPAIVNAKDVVIRHTKDGIPGEFYPRLWELRYRLKRIGVKMPWPKSGDIRSKVYFVKHMTELAVLAESGELDKARRLQIAQPPQDATDEDSQE